MQTLEVNYKSVFEALPGKNLLLLPDAPRYTIVTASDTYLNDIGKTRQQIESSGIFEVLSFDRYASVDEAFQELRFSLGYVAELKEQNTVEVPLPSQKDSSVSRVAKFTHKPVLSADGEVLYIVQNLTYLSAPSHPSASWIDFSSVLNQAPVALALLTGRDLVVEMANDYILRLWGKNRDVIGRPLVWAVPELRGQQYPRLLRNVFNSGREYVGHEMPATIVKDGKPRRCYLNFIYTPIKEQGATVGIMVVASDVTTLVESRKKLKESENRYRDLIANATVGTAVYTGADMRIHLANASMLRIWRKDRFVIGLSFEDAVPAFATDTILDILREVFTTGQTHSLPEIPVEVVTNGKPVSCFYNFTFKALRDSHGKIYGVLHMAFDVTESVRARMKIKEAEERWRIALDSAELGTWDYFPGTQTFICSARTLEMYGLPGNCQPTLSEFLTLVDEERERVQNELSRLIQNTSPTGYRIEYRIRRQSDNALRWIRTQGQTFISDQGEVYRITGTVFDITERKQIEEALEDRVIQRTRELLNANRELARSNHELEQYAYVASHDLQEPLRKILIYTDLMKENTALTGSADRVRLEKIMGSAMRMSHLIQDLLDFSRLIKSATVFQPVNLNDVVQDVLDDLELKIDETHATISCESLPFVEGSPQQMHQLFYNLINNALKFRKADVPPEIKISVRKAVRRQLRKHADLIPGLKYCHICVSDNGIGFDAKYGKQIFEIFKRLHPRSQYDGTGIGLALCRKITRNHKGEIYADARVGQGATFHIVLPLEQLPLNEHAQTAASRIRS